MHVMLDIVGRSDMLQIILVGKAAGDVACSDGSLSRISYRKHVPLAIGKQGLTALFAHTSKSQHNCRGARVDDGWAAIT